METGNEPVTGSKAHHKPSKFSTTFKHILSTDTVTDTTQALHSKINQDGKNTDGKAPAVTRRPLRLKRLSHNPENKSMLSTVPSKILKSKTFKSSEHCSSKTSKYFPSVQLLLDKAQGQKTKKFVLPTKSSRSSRLIKPTKRFLEDDEFQEFTSKQLRMSPSLPTSASTSQSLFDIDLKKEDQGSKNGNSFIAFQGQGLSLSTLNSSREKGFPAFTAAPTPSGTSSFTDGIDSQCMIGSNDDSLVVDGKRQRKPSLIMRMKFVEDDPDDEVRLQKQISNQQSNKSSPESPDQTDTDKDYKPSSSFFHTKPNKRLIAPAKLFTGSSAGMLNHFIVLFANLNLKNIN